MSRAKYPAKPFCRNWKRYTGRREPRCNGGYGCYACWRKYLWENDPTDHVA